ncbi:glycoside hydrolase family 15 protein [Fictibacillus barbaricus]|uniref:Oligosaccharide amylase n=1 Tax=Fictibacillus barbaricus TaxID=182136 RepID=A0ABU1TZT6_9BACL|nr:glycoside hydrolase family 15 protein [Fictibacillus barbaricus]MDR7072739.1 oligosaccharide amylase [Fictibacillus barbaricus]
MPRHLVLGNGKILINLDQNLQMRDIYYPYVGQQNHVQGHANRLGASINGSFSWLSSNDWVINPGYHKDSLVTLSFATNHKEGITLKIEDAVHQREDMFMRRITVINETSEEKKIKLFFHQDLSIYETEVGDTAYYDPERSVIIHYKKNRYFLFHGMFDGKGMNQYTTGVKRFLSAEGTWKDAEDGYLHVNPIAQGSVDSTFSVEGIVPPHQSKNVFYSLTVGRNREEVYSLFDYLMEIGPSLTLDKIDVYWRRWVNKTKINACDLSAELMDLYNRSLLIIRTQTNENGYIIAANDSDIQQYNRDHYSYMWPRDGALIAASAAKAGFHGMVKNFYRRCAEVLTKEGYLHHKYNPDGSIGSSWHPMIDKAGDRQLPIQEDETALVLWAFWEHYNETGDIEFAQSLYRSLVRPSARFLLQYMHAELDLPLPSYDLWEERRGIFTFTASSVYGGLMAAYKFATLFGEDDRAERYKKGAERVKAGMEKHLYDEDAGRFLRGIYLLDNNAYKKDFTMESSMYALFAFGVFSADDDRVVRTMHEMEKELSVKTNVGGLARYTNDYYFQQTHEIDKAPGNPWLICTLWLAKWYIQCAKSKEDLKTPRKILEWVHKHSYSTGVLSEQLHPFTGEALSVAPLTWSHATFVDAVKEYTTVYEKLS